MTTLRYIIWIGLIFSINNHIWSLITTSIITKVDQFHQKNKTMEGHFELYENNQKSSGQFFYRFPYWFKLVFKESDSTYPKTVISNGKILWAYLAKLNLVINQDLNDITLHGTEAVGIRKLILHHSYNLKNKNVPLKRVSSLKTKVYILKLATEKKEYAFKSIVFYIRKDGCILQTKAENWEGHSFIFIKKSIKLNPKMDANTFDRIIPKNAEVVKNPFVEKNNP